MQNILVMTMSLTHERLPDPDAFRECKEPAQAPRAVRVAQRAEPALAPAQLEPTTNKNGDG
jgi:hypothetical protein